MLSCAVSNLVYHYFLSLIIKFIILFHYSIFHNIYYSNAVLCSVHLMPNPETKSANKHWNRGWKICCFFPFPVRSAEIIRNIGISSPNSLSPTGAFPPTLRVYAETLCLPQDHTWHHFTAAAGRTRGVEREQLTRGDSGRAEWPDCSAGQATGKEGPRRSHGWGRGDGGGQCPRYPPLPLDALVFVLPSAVLLPACLSEPKQICTWKMIYNLCGCISFQI